MFEDILKNVAANLVTAFILAVLGLITFGVVYIIERERLLRFFGITNRLPELRIYVSRLEIKPAGTEGFMPISVGYTGPSISKIEYEAALLVRSLVRSRSLALIPRTLRDWLGQQNVSIRELDPSIDISPRSIEEVASDNLIVLGSPVYNNVSKHYFEKSSCRFIYGKDASGERGFKLRMSGIEDTPIQGRSAGRELAVLQRFNDPRHGNSVFVCAGLGGEATYGSVRYLVDNWKTLHRKYGEREFAICLAFPGQQSGGGPVVEPIIVLEMACD